MEGDDLVLVCYVSSATDEFAREDFAGLLRKSRERNEAVGITGLLMYHAGTFMQIIEGPKSRVEELYGRIRRDSRHRGILQLLNRRIEERCFGDWSMAYRDMSPEEEEQMGIYSTVMNEMDEEENPYHGALPNWIMRLVRDFKRVNR